MDQINKIWPKWHTVELIGRGAFGEVYKVKREELGETFYSAVKVIRIPRDDGEVREFLSEGQTSQSIRFYYESIAKGLMNEIKVLEQLKSAGNVVNIEEFEILEKEDGIGWDVYIRMELLRNLNEYRQGRQMHWQEVEKLGMDICKALEYCEQCRIIHRDIKPSNIFVDNYGNFKLGDFGIARQLEKTQSTLSQKGTEMYMAPEVRFGDRKSSYNVDIYSLGLVMYRLLNRNKMPFEPLDRDMLTYQDREEALSRRLRGDRLPLPADAPAGLGQIIIRACEAERDRRYQRASEMYEDLVKWQRRKVEDAGLEEREEMVPAAAPSGYSRGKDEAEEETVSAFRFERVKSPIAGKEAAKESEQRAATEEPKQEKQTDTAEEIHKSSPGEMPKEAAEDAPWKAPQEVAETTPEDMRKGDEMTEDTPLPMQGKRRFSEKAAWGILTGGAAAGVLCAVWNSGLCEFLVNMGILSYTDGYGPSASVFMIAVVAGMILGAVLAGRKGLRAGTVICMLCGGMIGFIALGVVMEFINRVIYYSYILPYGSIDSPIMGIVDLLMASAASAGAVFGAGLFRSAAESLCEIVTKRPVPPICKRKMGITTAKAGLLVLLILSAGNLLLIEGIQDILMYTDFVSYEMHSTTEVFASVLIVLLVVSIVIAVGIIIVWEKKARSGIYLCAAAGYIACYLLSAGFMGVDPANFSWLLADLHRTYNFMFNMIPSLAATAAGIFASRCARRLYRG